MLDEAIQPRRLENALTRRTENASRFGDTGSIQYDSLAQVLVINKCDSQPTTDCLAEREDERLAGLYDGAHGQYQALIFLRVSGPQ